MKTRLLLTFFLTVVLSGSGLASEQKHIELQYNSDDGKPLLIPLKEGSTLSIGTDGNVSAVADDSFKCDVDAATCDDVRVDMRSFTVNGGSSATVTQNKSVLFRWDSRGAYACDGSGLPNTTWNSNNKYPVDMKGVSVNVGELEPGDYPVVILCHNGPVFKTASVTVTVEEEVGVPEGCEGVAPGHFTRASYCDHNKPGADCFEYSEIFGGAFPGNTINRQFRLAENEYAAMRFTTPNDMKSGASGNWTVEAASTSTGLSTGGGKIWSISDCPGDFDRDRILAHPDLGGVCYAKPTMSTASIQWGGASYAGATNRCVLEPGKTYYLNVVYTRSSSGTNPDDLTADCGTTSDISVCSNTMGPVFNDG